MNALAYELENALRQKHRLERENAQYKRIIAAIIDEHGALVVRESNSHICSFNNEAGELVITTRERIADEAIEDIMFLRGAV